MFVAFFGHSSYVPQEADKKSVMEILEKKAEGVALEFLLGENGGFDDFAFECAVEFKSRYPESKLIFVTPYLRKSRRSESVYDQIIYPELENVPPKFAISRRNRWMVERSDFIIAYVNRSWGGAYATYSYAGRRDKIIFNIAGVHFER